MLFIEQFPSWLLLRVFSKDYCKQWNEYTTTGSTHYILFVLRNVKTNCLYFSRSSDNVSLYKAHYSYPCSLATQ